MSAYDQSREVSRMFRVFRTVKQMVKARGYMISDAELHLTLDEFRDVYAKTGMVDRASLTSLVQREDNPNEQLIVFFPDEKSVGIKNIRKYCERMVQQGITKAIIVFQHSITPSAAKIIAQMSAKYNLESFHETELLVNITEHELVPKHVVLTEIEKRELLEKYRLKETQLPRIMMTDPIARYYGMKRGNVVKILRPSETAGRYVTYRLCI